MFRWKAIYKTALRPFVVKENSDVIEKNINLARILVGLGILHSYLDSLGFSILLPSQDILKAITVLALSVFFTIGLFTPLVCGLLIYYFADPIIPYLGTMVLVILLWGMFFIGVGRRWSIDAYLFKSTRTRKIIEYFYIFSLPPGSTSLAKVRLFILLLFWCVCVRAMVFHLFDPLWLEGGTLQLVFNTPYTTDHYSYFQAFNQRFPQIYDLLCGSALFIQSFWEIFLFPLMFFKWGRFFVMVQGMAFFLASMFILNLGHLPYYEICMWVLVFNYSQALGLKKGKLFYDDRCNLCKRTVVLVKAIDFYNRIEVTGLSQAPPKIQETFLNDIQIVYQEKENLFSGFSAYYQIGKNIFPFCLVFPLLLIGKVTGLGDKTYNWVALRRKRLFGVCEPYIYASGNKPSFKARRWSVEFFSLFLIASLTISLVFQEVEWLGQGYVDVLNQTDLKSGSPGIVVIETDENGKFKRTVPFMDINGGRLSYLRNNLLYFNYSLDWQRRFTRLTNPSKLPKYYIAYFKKLAQKVGDLDSCLRYSNGLRYYRADLFLKKLNDPPSLNSWGEPNRVFSYSLFVNVDPLKSLVPQCQWAYNLPPGHFYSARRISITDLYFKNNPGKR